MGTEGSGGVNPQAYQKQYHEGADLAQRTFDSMVRSDNEAQKKEFDRVMNQAMDVMEKTAKATHKEDLLSTVRKLEQDYRTYQKHPTKEQEQKVRQDIDQARQMP